MSIDGKNQIEWKPENWAIDCDFYGDYSAVELTKTSEACLERCELNLDCTHYVWFNNTCIKKSGDVSKQMAFRRLGAICGIIVPIGI